MLISKFNLYRTEWLDLVFDDRNKEYGAYNLRQTYASTMVRAMSITFFSIAVLCGISIILNSEKPVIRITHYDPLVIPQVIPQIKKIDPPKVPQHVKAEPVKPVTTIKDVPPVVVIDSKAEKPVINDQIKSAIGPSTLKGEGSILVDIPVDKPTGGGDEIPLADNKVYSPGNLDLMPEPVGGSSAWAKFLNNNLRFPAVAQEDGISGKVLLSFIIEKDGHLSNITVDRPAGHGFDEEALRVLKLARAWKPGMQNGQPVRVKYSIPINFQLSE